MERINIGDAKDYAKGCFLKIIKTIYSPLEIEIDAMRTNEEDWCLDQKWCYERFLGAGKIVRYDRYKHNDANYFSSKYNVDTKRVVFFDPSIGMQPKSKRITDAHFPVRFLTSINRPTIIIFQEMNRKNVKSITDIYNSFKNELLNNIISLYYINFTQIGFWVFHKDCNDRFMEYNKYFPGRVIRLK